MIYLAVFGAMVCAFLGGFTAQWLFLRLTPKPDQCQPALEQLKEAAAPEPKKEVRKPVMRRQWSENIPAKDNN